MPLTSNWTRENLLWVAGLAEGEGYFGTGFTKHNKKKDIVYPQISFQLALHERDKDVLDRLHSIVGFGKTYGPYKNTKNGAMIYYRVDRAENVYAVSCALFPFMGLRRQEQIKKQVTAFQSMKGKKCP